MSSTGQPGRRVVRIGSLTVGDGPAVVFGGAQGRGPHADGLRLSLARVTAGDRPAVLAKARASWDGPLLAEPAGPGDLPAVAEHADAVVIGAEWTEDAALLRAAAGLRLPVIVRRAPGASLAAWLEAAGRCAEAGAPGVVLCEDTGQGVDLGLARAARERGELPVLAAAGDGAGLAAAAVAAGVDGIWLAEDAPAGQVAAAREAVTVVGALLRDERPATVAAARDAIDRTDAALAVILERRAALAGVVQRLKPVGGFAGRDPERERRIVAAMARRAPRLGERRLAPIMKAVIESGLHLAEELRGSPGDNGGEPAPGPETPAAARRHHD